MTPGQHRILLELSRDRFIDCGHFALAAEAIARGACEGLAIGRAGVWLVDRGRTRLECVAMLGNGATEPIEGVVLERDRIPSYFAALLAGEFIAAPDIRVHPALRELLPTLAARATAAVLDAPIRIRGGVIGVLSCEAAGDPRSWGQDDKGFAAALAELAARALASEANAQAQDELVLAHASLERQVAERTASLRGALEELKRTQAQLVGIEKMAAIGSLVAGVAHEINTPVGVAITAASHLQDVAREAGRLYDAGRLDQAAFEAFLAATTETTPLVVRNLERAAALIRSFKSVAVNQSNETLVAFELGAALEDLVRSLAPECRRAHAECVLDCPDPIPMHGYPGAIDQLVTNLVVNALRHAFPDRPGGRVEVAARGDGEEVVLEVRDDGAGVAPEIRARIFQPFVTSKRDQGGTGLGLHICYNVATQRLGGTIDAMDREAGGTTFRVRIPRALPAAMPAVG